MSAVPDLFATLSIAAVGVLLAETAKLRVAALPSHRLLCYGSFLLFQISLIIDALRRYAWDWYGYLLYFVRLITLSHAEPRPEVLPVSPPWLSFLVLIACLGICVFSVRGHGKSGKEAAA